MDGVQFPLLNERTCGIYILSLSPPLSHPNAEAIGLCGTDSAMGRSEAHCIADSVNADAAQIQHRKCLVWSCHDIGTTAAG